MDTPTPSPDHPAWGPPSDPRLAKVVSAPFPGPVPNRGTAGRRRHPAARARRIAGWATVASTAAIVGYMVTANVQQPNGQSVVTAVQQQPSVNPAANGDDGEDTRTTTAATQPALPAALPTARPAAPTQSNRQFPPPRPNSSSHGS